MADGPGSEIPKPNPQTEKKSSIWRRIREKFRKPKDSQGIPAEIRTTEPVFALNSYEIAKTLGTEEGDTFKKSEKLLFHTSPNERIPSIKEHGLIMDQSDPNIGEILGYSLYFAYEHARIRNHADNRESILDNTPDNYTLTVFRDAGSTHKSSAMEGLRLRNAKEPIDFRNIPEDFAEASPMGSYLEYQKLGKVPEADLIATIPLNKSVREGILECMINAEKGLMSADKIEKRLLELLAEEKSVYLGQGITREDLVHNLVGSMERNLIRGAVSPFAKEAADNPFIHQYRDTYSGKPIDALWRGMVYRSNINDPSQARYLDSVIVKLGELIKDQGLDVKKVWTDLSTKVAELKNTPKSPIRNQHEFSLYAKDGAFYGATSSSYAAVELQKKLSSGIRQ